MMFEFGPGAVALVLTLAGIFYSEWIRQPRNWRGLLSWVHLGTVVALGYVVRIAAGSHGLGTTTENHCCLGVAVLGWWIRFKSMRDLGSAFTIQVVRKEIKPDEQKVVNTGLYGVIRHPGYTSFLLCFPFAAIVTSGSYVYGGILFGITFYFYGVFLTRVEERGIMKNLDKEYKVYQEQVPYKMIPFIF